MERTACTDTKENRKSRYFSWTQAEDVVLGDGRAQGRKPGELVRASVDCQR